MNLTIRPAQPTDLPAYTDLLQQTYEVAYTDESIGLTKACFSPEIFATQRTQDYLKSHLVENDAQKTWLAFSENKLVAAITCILKDSHQAELTGFYVHPQFQNQGMGRRLYDQALAFAGKRDLVLDIYLHNHKTIEMYQKWGWQVDESRGDKGYFSRHWPEWPENLTADCLYMILKQT